MKQALEGLLEKAKTRPQGMGSLVKIELFYENNDHSHPYFKIYSIRRDLIEKAAQDKWNKRVVAQLTCGKDVGRFKHRAEGGPLGRCDYIYYEDYDEIGRFREA